MIYERLFKRVFDLCFATIGILVFAPVMILFSLAIWIEDGRPVFFIQRRVGKGGKLFRMLKFRSMPTENPSDMPSDAARALPITRVGRVLRRTNLDEIPQLINILRGEMSVVGPRPILPSQDHYMKLRSENGLHELKPGLTGLSAVLSWDDMTPEDKTKLDVRYRQRVTFAMDAYVILRTFVYLSKAPVSDG